jgi:hypothetical protein
MWKSLQMNKYSLALSFLSTLFADYNPFYVITYNDCGLYLQ